MNRRKAIMDEAKREWGKQMQERKEPVATKDRWEPCPRCESKRVKFISKSYMVLMLWLAGIASLLAGIIIWPLLPVAVIFLFASPFALFIPRMNKCKDCGYKWKVS